MSPATVPESVNSDPGLNGMYAVPAFILGFCIVLGVIIIISFFWHAHGQTKQPQRKTR